MEQSKLSNNPIVANIPASPLDLFRLTGFALTKSLDHSLNIILTILLVLLDALFWDLQVPKG